MKKITKSLLMIALALTVVLGVAACGGQTEVVTTGTAKAYALVHGQGYMGSVTAVVDSTSKVQYVQINEYFLPSTWAKAALTASKTFDLAAGDIDITAGEGAEAATAEFKNVNSFIATNATASDFVTAGNSATGTKFATSVGVITATLPALKTGSEDEFRTTVTANYWAKYIKIADKYFEATFTGAKITTIDGVDCYASNPVYKQIGVTTGGIANLNTYLKPSGATFANSLSTAATGSGAASKWYGEAVEKGEVWVLQTTTAAGVTAIKDAANQDVKLAYDAKAVGSSGGINKRFASYGSASYSWMETILLIENYIYESGYNYSVSTKAEAQAVVAGVTATDSADYMMLAKSACESAKAVADAKK